MEHGTLNAEEKNAYLKKVLTIEKERLAKFSEVGDENTFFFLDISYEKEMLRWKTITDAEIKKSLETSEEVLEKISDEDWTREIIEEKLLEAVIIDMHKTAVIDFLFME